MRRIPFEWLEFAFECFEFGSNGLTLHLNVPILFEWLVFAFKCFKFGSNGSNLHSNASNFFRIVTICILMFRFSLESFEFAFELLEPFEYAFKCFQSRSKCSNLHLNTSNPFRMVRICIRMLRIGLEFAFECF